MYPFALCIHLHDLHDLMTSWPHDLKTTDEHPLFLQTITQTNNLNTNHLQLILTSCRCRFCKQIPPISLDLGPKCCIFASLKGYHSHDWINETHNLQLQPENHQPQPLTIKIFTHYGNQVKATERNVSFEKNKEKWAYVMMPETYSTLVAIGTALGVSCIAGHWPARPSTGPTTLRSQPSETALQGCRPSSRPPPLPTWSGGGFSMGQKISQSLVEPIICCINDNDIAD